MTVHPNPVIAAVEIGHVNHGDKCVACSGGVSKVSTTSGIPYPCSVITDARVKAKARSERLIRFVERKRQLARA